MLSIRVLRLVEFTDLHGKVPGHKLAAMRAINNQSRVVARTRLHWPQSSKTSTDGQTSKAHFCDRSIDDAFLAKLVQQAFGNLHKSPVNMKPSRIVITYLVGTVVARDLLAHHKDSLVPKHLLLHCRVQGFTNCHLSEELCQLTCKFQYKLI
jgi:hypothetical protein